MDQERETETTFFELVKEYAKLEEASSSWDGIGEYVIIMPIGRSRKLLQLAKKSNRVGVRSWFRKSQPKHCRVRQR
ncbi:MAG: hypothetical protein UW18_C0011G0015 [Microgenomates group bacterium GW2011_GWF1_44_10]|nr:MAG: hypothetical protein UW18_C0011G0015 [Microgenomates group bacterium GW2011_GWF1_44_10]